MGKPFSLQSPEQIAKEYGGNKEKIRQAMAMGLVDPTAGVLGGMFIDRMRSAQSLEQGAQPTVAQQVLAPPAPASAPAAPPASGAAKFFSAPPPMAPQAPPMAPQAPPMGMASGGLTTLPIPDDMFDEQRYGGGGIVAFAGGGETLVAALRAMPEFGKLVEAKRAGDEGAVRALKGSILDKLHADGYEMQDLRGKVDDAIESVTANPRPEQFSETIRQGALQEAAPSGESPSFQPSFDPVRVIDKTNNLPTTGEAGYFDPVRVRRPPEMQPASLPGAGDFPSSPPVNVQYDPVRVEDNTRSPPPGIDFGIIGGPSQLGLRSPPLVSGRPEFPPVGLPTQGELPQFQVAAPAPGDVPFWKAALVQGSYNSGPDFVAQQLGVDPKAAKDVDLWKRLTTPMYPMGTPPASPEQLARLEKFRVNRAGGDAPSGAAPAASAAPAAPARAPTKEGFLKDAGPNVLNDRMLANIAAKNASAPTKSTAEMFFGGDNAAPPPVDRPQERPGLGGPRVDPVDPEVTKAVADVAEAAPGVPKIDYLEALARYRGEAPTLTAGESLADQKKQDFWSTIAQMGFGAAAGTSPNALANFSAGAAGAMPGMQKAMDRRREAQRDAAKAEDARKLAIFVSKGEDFKGADAARRGDETLGLNREQLKQTAEQNKAENLLRGRQIDVSAAGVAAQRETDLRYYTDPNRTPEELALAREYLASKSFNPYDPRKDQTNTQLDMAKAKIQELDLKKQMDGSLTPEDQTQYDAAMRIVYGAKAAAVAPAGGTSLVDKYAPRGG